MPLILALDTSTAACTAALMERDGTIIAERDELIGRGHAERLAPMIDEMLDGHVPTRILVGVGPGSFTGLRVGIAATESPLPAVRCSAVSDAHCTRIAGLPADLSAVALAKVEASA